ncbi:hypothetical protein VNI00_006633 [Paramarasmius palmivorus]|uniref:Glycosyl hydrolase family 95 N-terminal domain-containing protein n=1 Tax=Paramarasmius palmivorus TaxID=297713 RepID=A0AAW0D8I7_9AGAR
MWQDDLLAAQNMVSESCMANPIGQQMFQREVIGPFNTISFLIIESKAPGNLSLVFPLLSSGAEVTGYNHSLDLITAIGSTTYMIGGVQYTRTAFASHPDNVIVMNITANQPGKVEFEASFISPMVDPAYLASNNTLTMTGGGTEKYGVSGSIKFLGRVEVVATGSNATVGPGPGGDTLIVSGADEALLVLAIDTNYVRYDDISGIPEARISETLEGVRGKTWDELLEVHLRDYQNLFSRVTMSLGTPSENTYMPTNRRKNLSGGADADQDIFALYAQYGRYLSIASSRKTEPANLQGIWNYDIDPAWGSKYTLNINQQMNSWLAEPLNIAETLDPLWNMIEELAERGRDIAAEEYNISRGWVAHHNTNLWRDSAPIDGAFWGFWPLAPAWLMQNIWEHYAFDPSLEGWVRDVAYPLMKGLSEFYLDFLLPTPNDVEETEYLVTNPSMSPEHQIGTEGGTQYSLTYVQVLQSTMRQLIPLYTPRKSIDDVSRLLRDLFNHTVGFANLLGVDDEFVSELNSAMERLMPFRIGALGQLQEWARDYDSNGEFSHISQLYPLHPGAQIDPRFNTTLTDACKVTLELRGDSSEGWPTAWRANFYARLLDGEKAYYYMQRLVGLYSYDNLWSRNLVFQIDGNFGGANAVVEMVLQSHNGEIHLLPAIPESWTEGAVTGFRARGGFTVDISWSDGVLTSAMLTSTSGTFARVRQWWRY